MSITHLIDSLRPIHVPGFFRDSAISLVALDCDMAGRPLIALTNRERSMRFQFEMSTDQARKLAEELNLLAYTADVIAAEAAGAAALKVAA